MDEPKELKVEGNLIAFEAAVVRVTEFKSDKPGSKVGIGHSHGGPEFGAHITLMLEDGNGDALLALLSQHNVMELVRLMTEANNCIAAGMVAEAPADRARMH